MMSNPTAYDMPATEDSASDSEDSLGLFQEPSDYYPPEKPATFTKYRCKNGSVIDLRLVGHSPLWGHLLWNAGQVVSDYLEDNAADLVIGKDVLELGAGAGLPSLVSAVLGARQVVVTDYPDHNLIENLRFNIDHCSVLPEKGAIAAEGFLWGNSLGPLIAHLTGDDRTFSLLILADILFNHSEHEKLIVTIKSALKQDSESRALVFFTPYRPWLLEKDMHFFELARSAGFQVTKLLEHKMEKVMFDNDPGDEQLRRTVFGYELKWLSDSPAKHPTD